MAYKFIIITEDYDVFGTNSKEEADEVAKYSIVYDLETFKLVGDGYEEYQRTMRPWNDQSNQ